MNPLINPAESPLACVLDNPEEHFLEAHCPRCNHPTDAVCPHCGGHVEPAGMELPQINGCRSDRTGPEFYRHFISLVEESRNPKLFLACYYVATGDAGAQGLSMTDLAKRWSVKKATISKYCRTICERLSIPPSQYMRKEETADKFRLANRRPQKMDI
jgi:hypothetical protein